jgi:hypothetical protein
LKQLPDWFNMHYTGDYVLALRAAMLGKVVYFSQGTAAYRVLKNSISHPDYVNNIDCVVRVDKIFVTNNDFFNYLLTSEVINKKQYKIAISPEIYRYISRTVDCEDYKGALNIIVKQMRHISARHIIKGIAKVAIIFTGVIIESGV